VSTLSGWEDDLEILPDTTEDESARGWGDDDGSNDHRLLDERPPHWDPRSDGK
jgi:hypothetical protein